VGEWREAGTLTPRQRVAGAPIAPEQQQRDEGLVFEVRIRSCPNFGDELSSEMEQNSVQA
jgi:hypothetical protein